MAFLVTRRSVIMLSVRMHSGSLLGFFVCRLRYIFFCRTYLQFCVCPSQSVGYMCLWIFCVSLMYIYSFLHVSFAIHFISHIIDRSPNIQYTWHASSAVWALVSIVDFRCFLYCLHTCATNSNHSFFSIARDRWSSSRWWPRTKLRSASVATFCPYRKIGGISVSASVSEMLWTVQIKLDSWPVRSRM